MILEALKATAPPFGGLLAATTTSAVHLEMRDAYTPDDQRFLDWQAGKLLPEHANREWSAIVRSHTARELVFAALVSYLNRSRTAKATCWPARHGVNPAEPTARGHGPEAGKPARRQPPGGAQLDGRRRRPSAPPRRRVRFPSASATP
jgi:hypothetical protein